MLRYCFLLFVAVLPAHAEECRSLDSSLRVLKDKSADPELRAKHGSCLFRFHSDRTDAAQALLRIIRDPNEDTLLREDLVAAFAESPLRKRVKVEGNLGPELGKVEKTAVERTVASAGDILALTQAVKSMDEIVPTSRFEGEFVRALVEVAFDAKNHVLLRAVAVESLERVARASAESGVYDLKTLRLAHDTLRTIANLDEDGYYSGAKLAFNRIEKDAVIMAALNRASGRMLSSQGAK